MNKERNIFVLHHESYDFQMSGNTNVEALLG